MAARPVLIGVGTPYAGDDAAGLLVAERLAALADPGFDIRTSQGIAADIVTLMQDRDQALLIDACRSDASPGTIHKLDATTETLPTYLTNTSTHGMGLAEAIGLAKALGTLPARCAIWAIEGRSFELGAALAPEVEAAIENCVRALSEVLRARP